ncbi:MAG: YggT family protein [Defluviitaleaceae bacterium]|nr:YggT family protein [Defluviitaleaceae bacterium]
MNVAISQAIFWLATILRVALFIRAILSWIPGASGGFIHSVLSFITEPIVAPVRRLIQKSPLGGGMLDFSFIVVILLLFILTPILQNLAMQIPF